MKFVRQSIPTGVIAAVIYLIVVAVFVFNSNYTNIFLLFMANCAFAGVVLFGVVRLNYTSSNNAGAVPLFTAGWQTTAIGVVISTLGSLIFFAMQSSVVPENEVMQGIPATLGSNNEELFVSLMAHSIAVNAVLGIGAAGLGAAVVKRNQKTMGGRENV